MTYIYNDLTFEYYGGFLIQFFSMLDDLVKKDQQGYDRASLDYTFLCKIDRHVMRLGFGH